MPLGDGTGPPEGTGPMTGRGKGIQDPLFQLGCALNSLMPHNMINTFMQSLSKGAKIEVWPFVQKAGKEEEAWKAYMRGLEAQKKYRAEKEEFVRPIKRRPGVAGEKMARAAEKKYTEFF